MTDVRANRRPVVAVIGNAGQLDDATERDARELGRRIVDAGFRLVTGGLDGVMAAASRGGREADGWEEGRIVGVLPSYQRESANPWCDIAIPTGAQLARNVIVVAMADAVIAIAGGSGTLSELALAWQLGRPIVAVDARGGWAAELAGRHLDGRHDQPIHGVRTPDEAVARVRELLVSSAPAPDDIDNDRRRSS